MPPAKVLPGERYGKLTILRELERRMGERKVECLCDCGNTTVPFAANVRRGFTTSCGCFSTESHMTHGKTGSSEWRSWSSMKARCSNPNSPEWRNYGQRGIGYCDRWKSFKNFLNDMGERPSGMTLDRIDNNEGYSPENCRWATNETQHNNKRTNRRIPHDGESLTISQWARRKSIRPNTLLTRLNRGWTIDRALTTHP